LIGDPKETVRSNYWSVNIVYWHLPIKKKYRNYIQRFTDFVKGVHWDLTVPKKPPAPKRYVEIRPWYYASLKPTTCKIKK